MAIHGTVPDLTIILDLDPETGLARAHARRAENTAQDRFEKETVAVHEARRKAFRAIAEAEPDRCRIVDAAGDPETVGEAIWTHVAPLVAANSGGANVS